MLQIINHMLSEAPFVKAHGASGRLSKPSLIVMHYTASGGVAGDGDASFFAKETTNASAHFVIGRDGGITQCVPLNVRAWHAGVSIWRGLPNVNDFSIGIELDNYGYLTRMASGVFKGADGRGEIVNPGMVVEAKHKNGKSPYQYWEAYTEKQIASARALCRALVAAYPSITEIVGHDDIAPNRKTDPGPAFNMSSFRSLVFGRDDKPFIVDRTVNASSLKVRSGGGLAFPQIDSLMRGDKVQVIYDDGDWSRIEYEKGQARNTGWVFDQYLT